MERPEYGRVIVVEDSLLLVEVFTFCLLTGQRDSLKHLQLKEEDGMDDRNYSTDDHLKLFL